MLTMKRMVGLLATVGAGLLLVAAAHAATTSDQPAAVLIYPKIVFNAEEPHTDTIIEIANATSSPVHLHCFYVNATGHCSNNGIACDTSLDCIGTALAGTCLPGWAETDFSVVVTHDQPFYWLASSGRNRTCDQNDTCEPLPLLGYSHCENSALPCTNDDDCGVGGNCIDSFDSNAGTSIPPVPEDLLFVGELKCVVVDNDGFPELNNAVYGQATLVTQGVSDGLDAQSYNATGIKARGTCSLNGDFCDTDEDCGTGGGVCESPSGIVEGRVLLLGSSSDDPYNACAETLILDHIFDGAPDPIGNANFYTDLTLVPCTEDFATGTANLGRSTAQFLVFNEFEQRFSTSLPVTCFEERLLSNIDTRNNDRSIFSVTVSGTIAGQSRITAVGSGLTGVARAMKSSAALEDFAGAIRSSGLPPVFAPGAGYELHQQGQRTSVDEIILP